MKKFVSIFLLLCVCFGLAACGSSGNDASASNTKASSASPSASSASESAAPAPTPTPTPTPVPTIDPVHLQEVVNSLNVEEIAQRKESDPSMGIFEVSQADNTLNYKISMQVFEYVITMAQQGDEESLNAYNRLLDSLPAVGKSLEDAMQKTLPGVHVDVILMFDEYTPDVAAVIHDGSIIYDVVNGVGTAPADVKPIVNVEELPPELQAKIQAIHDARVAATAALAE